MPRGRSWSYNDPSFSTAKLTATIPIADMADLKSSLLWFADLLPETAKEELAIEQSRGNLLNPVTYVDGRKNDDVDQVKPFGQITYTDDVAGLLAPAIAAADAFVRGRAPVKTGHYSRQFVWNMNGRPAVGLPDAKRVGPKGNVELFDLAPYASVVEVDIPTGVIFGAFKMLLARYAGKLKIGFRYVLPLGEHGTLRPKAGNPPRVPYYIPVLTIGGMASNVISGVMKSTPGYALRRGTSKFSRRGTRERYKKKFGK